MPHAVLLTGAGDYADPWHPFDVTGARVRTILEPIAGDVVVRTDVEAALAEQSGDADLLVVNIGNAGPGTPGDAARTGLLRHLEAGRPLLVLHVSATAFPDWPEWEAIVGGRWVEGTTFHPEKTVVAVRFDPGHAIATGQRDFVAEDEAYTALRVGADVTVLAHHELDGAAHPLGWVHRYRTAPVAYLALGHDGDAYEAEGTRQLVGRTARWLLDAVPGNG